MGVGGFVFPLRRKVQGEIALVTGKMLHLHFKPFARASISLKLSLLAELTRYHNRFESMRLDLELGGEKGNPDRDMYAVRGNYLK